MPKPNPALLLLALISIGALTNFKGNGRGRSSKEIDQALIQLTEELKDHNQTGQNVSMQPILDQIAEEVETELKLEKEALEKELNAERRLYAQLDHKVRSASLQSGYRKAKQVQSNLNAERELASQKIYQLERQVKENNNNIKQLLNYM